MSLPTKASYSCDLSGNVCNFFNEGWSGNIGECGATQYYAWQFGCEWQPASGGTAEYCLIHMKVEYPGSTTLIQKCL